MAHKDQTVDQPKSDGLVTVRSTSGLPGVENIYFIFTLKQVEEVLADLPVNPVPFTPLLLGGMARWRKRFVPVIDLDRRFGTISDNGTQGSRFLVVKMAFSDNGSDNLIQHIVLKVPDAISTMNIRRSDEIYSEGPSVINDCPVRDVFRHGDDMLVAPDLLKILDMDNCFDKGE